MQKLSFNKWLELLKKDQQHYEILKGKKLDEIRLLEYYQEGFSTIDALNDLVTVF